MCFEDSTFSKFDWLCINCAPWKLASYHNKSRQQRDIGSLTTRSLHWPSRFYGADLMHETKQTVHRELKIVTAVASADSSDNLIWRDPIARSETLSEMESVRLVPRTLPTQSVYKEAPNSPSLHLSIFHSRHRHYFLFLLLCCAPFFSLLPFFAL